MNFLTRLFSRYGLTGAAQVLTFLSLLLPVFTGDSDKIAFATVPLAFGVVASRFATLGFHATYLRDDERSRPLLLVNAVWGILVGTSTLIALGWTLGKLGYVSASLILYVGVSVAGQSLYIVGITMLIASRDLPLYGRVRLAYGLLVFLLTALAVSAFDQLESLLVASSVSSGVAGVGAIISCRAQFYFGNFRLKNLLFSTSVTGGAFKVALGSATGDLGAQAGAFALPFMGEYGPLWASMFRISGGFSTVAQQIVAPPIEMNLISAINNESKLTAQKFARKGLLLGCLLALISILVQWVVFALVDDPSYDAMSATPMIFISLYTLATVGIGCVQRLPLLLKRDSAFFVMQAARLGGFVVVIGSYREIEVIAGLVLVQLLAAAWFSYLSVPGRRDRLR